MRIKRTLQNVISFTFKTLKNSDWNYKLTDVTKICMITTVFNKKQYMCVKVVNVKSKATQQKFILQGIPFLHNA
jgi:hypothetical protein